jgi:hypothetical protein
MRIKFTGSLLVAATVFMAAGAFAQTTPAPSQETQPQEKKALDTSLKISGVIYTEYAHLTGLQPGSVFSQASTAPYTDEGISSAKNDTFRVNRVYINLRKNFTETLSMRVTTDVEASGAPTLYLKYAFFQYKDSFFDFLGVNLQGGLIGTPVIGLLDDISGCRWIYQNLLDKSANMLNGYGVDSSADYGARLALTFANMVTVTGAVTNGEGYKKNAGGLTDFDGMAYYGMINVNPISQLYISGFYRYEEYKNRVSGYPGSDISDRGYYGFGVAWKSDLIMAGAHYWLLWNNDRTSSPAGTVPPRVRKHYGLLEAYVMVNLGVVVPTVPLLIHGRYSDGVEQASLAGNSDIQRRTRMIAAGLGWAFNGNLRTLAYYERYAYDIGRIDPSYRNPKPASNFMVKCEVAF